MHEDAQKNHSWSSIFDNQQNRTSLNIILVIINIVIFNIKGSSFSVKTIDNENCLLIFFRKGWGIKHRFSERLMADISHRFSFSPSWCRIHTRTQQIKTKTESKCCKVMEMWKFLNQYLFNSKGDNFVNQKFGLQFRSFNEQFGRVLVVFSSSDVPGCHWTQKASHFDG